jgi:ADP-ribose pyrophosphatase
MKNQLVGQKIEYQGPVFDVLSCEMILPDGRRRNYDLIKIQNAVTILPIDEQGCIYFVRQYRIGAGKEMLELPAGKIEEGESALSTAEREIREEIGMAAEKLQPLGEFFVSPGYSDEYMYNFLATGLHSAPLDPDQDEFLNVIKLTPAEVRELIASGNLQDSKSLAALFLAQPLLQAHSSRS